MKGSGYVCSRGRQHTGSRRRWAAWGRESCSQAGKECEPVGFELRTASWLTTGLPAPWKGKVYPGSLASRCQSSRLGAKPGVPAQHEGAEPPFFCGDPLGLGLRHIQSVRWTNDERAIRKCEGRGSPLAPLNEPGAVTGNSRNSISCQ